MEGIALPAVSSSSCALRLHVTIFSTLDSQTARIWASGSTQQRGDYHINPRKHSVSQVFVHLDTVFHFAPYSTQQVMTLILTSFFQFLCYFLGQERINCCELHWTIEQVDGERQHHDRQEWDPSCASGPSESRSQAVRGTMWGHCASLWGSFIVLLLHLQR